MKLSQEEIAAAVGGKGRSWRGYEKGEQIPGGQVLEGLSQLGISIDWLFTGEGEIWRSDRDAAVGIDQGLLQMIIEETEIYIDECNLNWTPEKKARVIIAGYDMMREGRDTEGKTNPAVMSRLLKAAV